MTEDEAYKVHIQYTFNAFCKVVILFSFAPVTYVLYLNTDLSKRAF